jgi:regulator of sigma E protease
MSFLQVMQNISPFVVLFNIAAFIVALLLIVFVHEFGHYIVARWCGVKSDVFSVGFGKEIWGFTDKRGTRWKLAPWPIGGYVKFAGDANAASKPDLSEEAKHTAGSLHAQPVAQRAAIVAAGPIANFILAIFIFAAGFMIVGQHYMRPIVDDVLPGSAASEAGMKPGDEITNIDGTEITNYMQIQELVMFRPEEQVVIGIKREGQALSINALLKAKEIKDDFGGTFRIGQLGISHNKRSDEPLVERLAPHEALMKGAERTWFIIATTGKTLKKLFLGTESVKRIGGAISIGKGAGDAASDGPMAFVSFIAFLSVSIGIVNLLPIPMLDGGHLVFYAIEALRGKPLGPVAQEWGFRIGFTCVVMLMLLGLFNDTGRVANVLFGT